MPRKTRAVIGSWCDWRTGFNEAAARCRGKPSASKSGVGGPAPGFNEAAARCRGKRPRRAAPPSPRPCFNEAAARCRGKRERQEPITRAALLASMRPRPDAAENASLRYQHVAALKSLQ